MKSELVSKVLNHAALEPELYLLQGFTEFASHNGWPAHNTCVKLVFVFPCAGPTVETALSNGHCTPDHDVPLGSTLLRMTCVVVPVTCLNLVFSWERKALQCQISRNTPT